MGLLQIQSQKIHLEYYHRFYAKVQNMFSAGKKLSSHQAANPVTLKFLPVELVI